ncbi:hypothetical protein [Haliangium ochraceum]|uniref:CHRD domain containing protein n=1 Tax=Haliangium ochraceum (strain DSM 14365 / JCM 11303 / SMP-2) TaxID=502025 RepID=D0LHK5_HALO1|nr:hypothetical protein [Haliangium ochraceum]ACY12867.1 hypothetical protein Hoch_0226 [Haliangium ochraceum DSM 14365]
MLRRIMIGALALPLAGTLAAGCGDDGGDGGDVDAAPLDGGQVDAAPTDAGATDGGMVVDETVLSVAGGRFDGNEYEEYQDRDLFGAGQLVRLEEGTRAALYIEGLDADTEYIAHVHALPCTENQAGGHYKLDPSIAEEQEDNEIWLRFTTNADGIGMATAEALGHTARGDAQAIVIHDSQADGAKMTCVDLRFNEEPTAAIEYSGSFSAFDGVDAADANIAGTSAASVEAGTTAITMAPAQLDEAGTYEAHVHMLPCALEQGGGHYKRDTTIAMERENNEIWPAVDDPDPQDFNHALRGDAQSIVIHRAVSPAEVPKVACADLVRQTEIPEFTSAGQGGALEGAPADYDELAATVELVRGQDGSTSVTLAVAGLPADTTGFGAHVHAGTCKASPPGGPHYKLDPTIAEEQESNEIWLNFDSEADGTASSSASVDKHVARADAIALVIHDPASGDRVSCVELAPSTAPLE